ncbi:YpiF family protein [Ectobacillus sp. JY-23]|uniref:DUF2487 family protein n=1 Tax=Ectobacillus sp. JY-23 TaxID=2933872 RepID=UPI001FF4C569|nr:DUF2487 family protein [Ectobacillus sp. JY-23]UOY93465.1 YpiF family protein [Ectobacillus sp. JY-23]
MKWRTKDIEVYETAKEYIDTALVPLIPFALEGALQEVVRQGEFVDCLSAEMEREYKGRIVLLPPFTYLTSEKEDEQERLKRWESRIKESGIKHIVYITSDYEWKACPVQETVIWLPAIPLYQLEEHTRRDVLQANVRDIHKILTEKWEKTE